MGKSFQVFKSKNGGKLKVNEDSHLLSVIFVETFQSEGTQWHGLSVS